MQRHQAISLANIVCKGQRKYWPMAQIILGRHTHTIYQNNNILYNPHNTLCDDYFLKICCYLDLGHMPATPWRHDHIWLQMTTNFHVPVYRLVCGWYHERLSGSQKYTRMSRKYLAKSRSPKKCIHHVPCGRRLRCHWARLLRLWRQAGMIASEFRQDF